MNQYNLIELAMVLLFGLLGGMLFYGRRGFLPAQEARQRGVFLAGGILCVVVGLLRVYMPLSLYIYGVQTASLGGGSWICCYGPLWPSLLVALLSVALLVFAMVLCRWTEALLAQAGSRKAYRIYQLMWWLCVAGFGVLFSVETCPILREMFPG